MSLYHPLDLPSFIIDYRIQHFSLPECLFHIYPAKLSSELSPEVGGSSGLSVEAPLSYGLCTESTQTSGLFFESAQ